jgi:hypothetical protein
VGGKAGDQFFGPTCNNDGTYRTCFYVSGAALPADSSGYSIVLDGVEYPVAFSQVVTAGTEVVVCATELPPSVLPVDVDIELEPGCGIAAESLYNTPSCPCPQPPCPLPNGALCAQSSECVSGNCVDGVCCGSVCEGDEICNVPGRQGKCTPSSALPVAPAPALSDAGLAIALAVLIALGGFAISARRRTGF